MARRDMTGGIVSITIGVCSGNCLGAGGAVDYTTATGSADERDGAAGGIPGDGDCAQWSSARPGNGNGNYDRSTNSGRIG